MESRAACLRRSGLRNIWLLREGNKPAVRLRIQRFFLLQGSGSTGEAAFQLLQVKHHTGEVPSFRPGWPCPRCSGGTGSPARGRAPHPTAGDVHKLLKVAAVLRGAETAQVLFDKLGDLPWCRHTCPAPWRRRIRCRKYLSCLVMDQRRRRSPCRFQVESPRCMAAQLGDLGGAQLTELKSTISPLTVFFGSPFLPFHHANRISR